MADDLKVHMGEGSPESIAFKLLLEIGHAEGMGFYAGPGGQKPTRAWILDTYAKCRRAVVGMDHNK